MDGGIQTESSFSFTFSVKFSASLFCYYVYNNRNNPSNYISSILKLTIKTIQNQHHLMRLFYDCNSTFLVNSCCLIQFGLIVLVLLELYTLKN
jgi:hypothetical protein